MQETLKTVIQRFQGSCLMIMNTSGDTATFASTGFLVSREGYILTSSRGIQSESGLTAVPLGSAKTFPRVTMEQVAPIPVDVKARDDSRDIALLKLKPELEINTPENILGSSGDDPPGAGLVSLGIPFGHYRIHGVLASGSMLSGRVESGTGTRLIIFDRRIHYGDIGGPLISLDSGRVIGITAGVFDPLEMEGTSPAEGINLNSSLSYAVAVEYGADLLEKASAG